MLKVRRRVPAVPRDSPGMGAMLICFFFVLVFHVFSMCFFVFSCYIFLSVFSVFFDFVVCSVHFATHFAILRVGQQKPKSQQKPKANRSRKKKQHTQKNKQIQKKTINCSRINSSRNLAPQKKQNELSPAGRSQPS